MFLLNYPPRVGRMTLAELRQVALQEGGQYVRRLLLDDQCRTRRLGVFRKGSRRWVVLRLALPKRERLYVGISEHIDQRSHRTQWGVSVTSTRRIDWRNYEPDPAAPDPAAQRAAQRAAAHRP